MLRWRIYYGDGTTFDNLQGDWLDAPSRGVLCVTSASEETGQRCAQGRNFYVMTDWGEVYGMDWPGLWDLLIQWEHPEAHKPLRDVDLDAMMGPVKYGEMVPREVFQRIFNRAKHDPDFPQRSARDRDDKSTGEA